MTDKKPNGVNGWYCYPPCAQDKMLHHWYAKHPITGDPISLIGFLHADSGVVCQGYQCEKAKP